MNWYRAPCCASCINHEASCLCKCEKAQLGTQHRALGIMLWAIELLKYIPWPNFSRKSRFEIPFYYGKQVYNCSAWSLFYVFALKTKLYLSWHDFPQSLNNCGANSKVTDKKIKCSFRRQACQEYCNVSQYLDICSLCFKRLHISECALISTSIFLEPLSHMHLIKTI